MSKIQDESLEDRVARLSDETGALMMALTCMSAALAAEKPKLAKRVVKELRSLKRKLPASSVSESVIGAILSDDLLRVVK